MEFSVQVDRDLCIGIGACEGLAPDLFHLHDSGYASVRLHGAEAERELLPLAREAAQCCPMGAIRVESE